MKPLRIGIAARGLNSYASGPNEYIDGFISQLTKQSVGRHEIFVYYNARKLSGQYPGAHDRFVFGENAFFWDHFSLPISLIRDGLDMIIYPKGTVSIWAPTTRIPIMLDLAYFYPVLNAYKTSNTMYTRQAMKFAARVSPFIFTISNRTREDVIALLQADPKRVFNIYGAASKIFRRVEDPETLSRIKKKYDLPEKFMFYPASLSPRKNFHRILESFARVQQEMPHRLLFTGAASWNMSGLEDQLGRLSNKVRQLGEVPREDMPAIYTLADFAIYPSLFEGLGLPVLEAFQCGVPLMASNQTSIPELTGDDAALLVDAYSVESISRGMIKMSTDMEFRNKIVASGYERAKLFTWENTVTAFLDAIERHF